MGERNVRDDELVREFFRVERDDYVTVILVRMIGWDGPADPHSTWVIGSSLTAGAGQREIQSAIKKLLGSKRFFRVCEECGERNPLGHMDDKKICQACAVRNHGVVY